MLRRSFRIRCLKHSLYKCLSLISNLFIPLVIGILAIVLPLQQQNLSENRNADSKITAHSRRLKSMEALRDEQKQMILNTYQNDLTRLLLKFVLSKKSNDDERISLIIRTKTLHALRQLDPKRQVFLVQLLFDSGIQHRINISHVDLSSLVFPRGSFYKQLQFSYIRAEKISFRSVFLYQSNFSYSILDDSIFRDSNCSYVDFSHASLERTDWTNADLTQAMFNYSNLHGAKITREQLAQAQSLQGAILPNGSISSV